MATATRATRPGRGSATLLAAVLAMTACRGAGPAAIGPTTTRGPAAADREPSTTAERFVPTVAAPPFDLPTTIAGPDPFAKLHLRGLPATWSWADTYTFGPSVPSASPPPASWLRIVGGVHQILQVRSQFNPTVEDFDGRDDLVAIGPFRGEVLASSPFFGRRTDQAAVMVHVPDCGVLLVAGLAMTEAEVRRIAATADCGFGLGPTVTAPGFRRYLGAFTPDARGRQLSLTTDVLSRSGSVTLFAASLVDQQAAAFWAEPFGSGMSSAGVGPAEELDGRRIVSELFDPLPERRDDTPTNVELGVALRTDVYAEVHLQGVTWTEVARVLDALAGGVDDLLSLPPPVTGPRPAFGPVDGGASVVVVGSVGGANAVEWREPNGGAVRIVRTAADAPHRDPVRPDRGGRPATVLGQHMRIDTSTGVWTYATPTADGAGLWIVASGIAAPRLAQIVGGITLVDEDGWATYVGSLPFEPLV